MVSGLLCAALLAGALTGCGQSGDEQEGPAKQRTGKYVEKELTLPEECREWVPKQTFATEDKLCLLFAKEQGDSLQLCEWQYGDEGFTKITPEWLREIELPSQTWMDVKLLQGGDAEFLFANYVEGDTYRAHLWRYDGENVTDITPQEWTVFHEEWQCFDYVNSIAALSDGRIAAASSMSFDILYGEDGSVLESMEQAAGSVSTVLADGDNFYLLSETMTGTPGIEKWVGGKSDVAESIPNGQESMNGLISCARADGALILAGADGIFCLAPGDKNWEKLLRGQETAFSMTQRWCSGLAALTDGSIYAMFQGEDGLNCLMEYRYDPDAVDEVKEVLRLFTVQESFLMQNAAALYHRAHPEIMIEVESFYSYEDFYAEEAPDYNDAYQKLNTMLMGEEAPDILVLDHLDIDAYAQKGLLADLQQIVLPMEENGELLANITTCFSNDDGSRYAVPLEFQCCFALGRGIVAEDMASLEALADFLEGETESCMGQQTVAELVDRFYPYFCGQLLSESGLDIGLLEEKLLCMQRIAKNSGIVAAHDENNGKKGHCYNEWDLASHIRLAFVKAGGFNDSMFPMAITDYVKGEFTAFENCFLPSCQIAVCTKGRHQETAGDFIRFALSEEVQSTDYYSGFPVNAICLEQLALADRSDIAAYTTIEAQDGSEAGFEIGNYSQETAEKLVELCRQLDRPAVTDEKIKEVLTEALTGLLIGGKTMEQTLKQVEGSLKMYLAE